MAKRPVFTVSTAQPYFVETRIDFQYFSGFALVQQQKSIGSLHQAYLLCNPNHKLLEISSKSENELGVQLSAFNLMIEPKDKKAFSVEGAFQSSKVFEFGGPYLDLRYLPPREAKKDPRLKNSGQLMRFEYSKKTFELNPTTFFYDWLYIHSLNLQPNLAEQLSDFDAFTDIAFNPEKSKNCQARSAAIYVSLFREGILEKALESKESFLEVVYGTVSQSDTAPKQLDFGDEF